MMFDFLTMKEILFLGLFSITTIGLYLDNIINGRFIIYKDNKIEIVKDRKLDKEHIIYKDRKIS